MCENFKKGQMRKQEQREHMREHKLHSGTSKTKADQGGLLRVALFWKSHCATCSPACVILHHVTGSCKGPMVLRYINDRWEYVNRLI